MNRDALEYLMKWKESKFRKPLIIKGARQVGKTWLMRKFGENYYSSVAYINFENNDRMKQLFDKDYDIDRLIFGLQIESNTQIDENTLVIFDEIQEVPKALTSLKYFKENAPQYHVLAAGSALGVGLHEGFSFPVGKVDFLNLYPMTFLEFLQASENNQLVDLIKSRDFDLMTVFKDKIIDLLKHYYFIGGMPEAVFVYQETYDLNQVRDVHRRLIDGYEQDFSKHVPNLLLPRVRMAWQSIPAQLSRENRKFVYGLVKEGARAREYEIALQWLFDMNVAAKVVRITKPDIPLNAYQDPNSFKIFMNDVGLLSTLSNLDMKRLLEGNQIFEEFKGALTEQFVFQEIRSLDNLTPHYWSADRSSAEVDFVIEYEGKIVPIEVKATNNLRGKSLKSYFDRYHPEKSIRTSLADFRDEGWLINIPLYALSQFLDITFAPD
ncbi:MAG: ATP-binding protein [Anaerolineaceae bacterium]|jgi:predicted AAA+ superfamily ATPase|nr:ATP-binding protein [Anaerolineaceae bacterium]